MRVGSVDTYEVKPLEETNVQWTVRRRLRRAQREGRTGLLADARIPSGTRSLNRYQRVVGIYEGSRELFLKQPGPQLPHWVDLEPGVHHLRFAIEGGGGNVFTKSFTLQRREILVAVCHTTHSFIPFNRNPRPNRWYLGVVGLTPNG
jgi:hypothetical protein